MMRLLLKWNETYSTSFSGRMYGGGLVTWYRDTSTARAMQTTALSQATATMQ